MKRPRWVRRRILLILILALVVYGALMTPRLVKPMLAMRLSQLFNMPVTMDTLDIDWGKGEVVATNVRFRNQEGFIDRAHLYVAELRGRADWSQLLKKRIHIFEINLYRPVYVIERKITEEGVKNNVVMWWRWIKSRPKKAVTFLSSKYKWSLLIDRINIREGEFLYHQYGGDKPERKYYFRSIHGHLSGLHWPDERPELLDQEVFLKALVGERHPVPCKVWGRASFATSKISFDLSGVVRNGSVLDYEHLWGGLPVRVQRGKYDLDTRVLCLRRNLESHNTLVLKDLKLKSRRSLTGTIWGMPVKTWVRFVESEKTLKLTVPFEGEISSPSIGSGEALNAAFQEALRRKTERGLKFFTSGAVQIASQTESLVRETPGFFFEGFERLATWMPKVDLNGRKNSSEDDVSLTQPASDEGVS